MAFILKVLICCDYYLPGYKAGGPIRTLSCMIEQLGGGYEFSILTRDRDIGDSAPYDLAGTSVNIPVGKASVTYLEPAELRIGTIRKVIATRNYDLLYVNSFFSVPFSIIPLLLRRFGLVPERPVIIAPRGEFARSALAIGRLKKRVFLLLAKVAGIYTDVTWQASSGFEASDIRRYWGRDARISVAPDIAAPAGEAPQPRRSAKLPGRLDIVFLSRISPMKHLDFALEMLKEVRGKVRLDIYGPLEDSDYWEKCQGIIKDLPPDVTVEYRGALPIEQVTVVLAGYDLFFLPTLGESFGHAIIEALSAGCPVLISDRTPWQGLVSCGAGWDVPLENPAAFRAILQECVDMNSATLHQLSVQARTYAISPERQRSALEQNRKLFDAALHTATAHG